MLLLRAVFPPVPQRGKPQGGSRRLLQELDCGYASECGKRIFCQAALHPRFEALGLDTAPLLQAREAYKREQEQKRREQEQKKAEERRVREEQHQLLLDEHKQKFLEGERITGTMFLEIAKRDGFEIHIRTKGVLGSRVKQLDKSGSITYSRPRGSRSPDFSGCHKAISAYLKFLETVALS